MDGWMANYAFMYKLVRKCRCRCRATFKQTYCESVSDRVTAMRK